MIANCPEGFEYVQSENQAMPVKTDNAGLKSLLNTVRWTVSPYYNYAKVMLGSPKVWKFSTDCPLIHSTQSLLDTKTPYVVDFEHAAVFAGYNQGAFRNAAFVHNLTRALEKPNLKRLLAWSDAAAQTLRNAIPSTPVHEKIETVYPVMSMPQKISTKNVDSTIRFLFIGGNFYEKGGPETLAAFEKLAEKYDVHLSFISAQTPQEYVEKYKYNPKIKISLGLPYSEVQTLYSQSHVFVIPTHMDTFGFVISEALSYGLPVITEDSFSRPELVEHEKTGLIVKSYYSCFGKDGAYIYGDSWSLNSKRKISSMFPPVWAIDELYLAMERMVIDSKLRNECARNARKIATEGKLSPKRWKQSMSRIYNQALE